VNVAKLSGVAANRKIQTGAEKSGQKPSALTGLVSNAGLRINQRAADEKSRGVIREARILYYTATSTVNENLYYWLLALIRPVQLTAEVSVLSGINNSETSSYHTTVKPGAEFERRI
jgi:hypothetical protein